MVSASITMVSVRMSVVEPPAGRDLESRRVRLLIGRWLRTSSGHDVGGDSVDALHLGGVAHEAMGTSLLSMALDRLEGEFRQVCG